MKYKIIDPKGLLIGGEIKPQGEIIEAAGAQRDAWLYFQQISPADEAAEEDAARKGEFEESKSQAQGKDKKAADAKK